MFGRPNALLVSLLATTVVVTTALGWFGWRLVVQQRALDEQRVREQLEQRADLVAAAIRGKLAETGERLSSWLASPVTPLPAIDAAVIFTAGPDGVVVAPESALPFVPEDDHSPPLGVFDSIEVVEFGQQQLASAADKYRQLVDHREKAVRAGALLRLARVLRKTNDFPGALDAYRRLAALGATRTDNLPAELAGLGGQRVALLAMGDHEDARRVAAQIEEGLDSGRWLITRGTAEVYRDEVGVSPRPNPWKLANALSNVWREAGGQLPSRGQRVFSTDGGSVLVLWRSGGERTILLAAFAERFLAPLAPDGMAWRLDADDLPPSGDVPGAARSASRVIGGSEYPFTLRLWSTAPLAQRVQSEPLLIAMTLAMLAFLWGATYFMARAIRRESEVARLQSDFVAAVSHEFRSPLTTIRQMAEMLQMGRLQHEDRRRTYYGVLAAEAARLQRLVETLLNFGKMEAGAERYLFSEVDAAALVRGIVTDLEPQARAAGQQIAMSAPPSGPRVRADESALAVALRNLIDNALKYSPRDATVSVDLRAEQDLAAISIVDHGPGIPRAEQEAIFRKFVRGRAAMAANVKGTGVGLSMVRQIVAAHGGEVRLDSEPGRGSTFSVLLPLSHET